MPNLAELYRIDQFNDTFALGHYARVTDALDRRTGQMVAFKVLRPEHLGGDAPKWETRAFGLEADLLMRLAESPHVVNLMECGFLSAEGEAPHEGEIEPYGRDTVAFADALADHHARGWRPYLALERLPRTNNLFYAMRPDRAGLRWRLPTEEGLALALQFGETLRLMHRLNIVYMDHKLEHVYWDGGTLRLIDLNSSRLLERGQRGDEFRQDIHNLSVGILYSAFTGLSPQKTTLRPQPGNLSEVDSRYSEVKSLDFGVEPSLSSALQALLQRGAAGQIANADDFLDGLRTVAGEHGWDFPGHYTRPASRDARAQMRAGLSRLRKGEDYLREARDLFRDAAVQEDISKDLEAELRRLVKSVSEMLNGRVIP